MPFRYVNEVSHMGDDHEGIYIVRMRPSQPLLSHVADFDCRILIGPWALELIDLHLHKTVGGAFKVTAPFFWAAQHVARPILIGESMREDICKIAAAEYRQYERHGYSPAVQAARVEEARLRS